MVKFTHYEACQKLGITLDEVHRAMGGLGLGIGGARPTHLDEKQVFAISKWLHRNPKTGLTVAEVAEANECAWREVSEACLHKFKRVPHFIPEGDVASLVKWIKRSRGK